MSRWRQLRIAILFALFEALMPILGLLIGEQLAGLIGDKAKYVGIVVLAAAGLYSFFKRDNVEEPEVKRGFDMRTILLAVALSLDNLSVGFGLGMFHVPLGLAAIVFGAVSLCMTLIG
ncbi:MAG: manganese efflux pump MntP family protein, partial [Alicyclobacillus sp.]|nr:manganese efflux pump MntP family protein [Alicyclobacillus sp.]